jgi:hypothetical protein
MLNKYFQPLLLRDYVVRYNKADKEVQLTNEEKLPVSFQ